MSDRIEALAQRLVADMEITRSMGHKIHPTGSYVSGLSCGVCLLGSVLAAAGESWEVGRASHQVARLAGITVNEADCLEWGFCWPDTQGPMSDPDFFALGKRLREDVLAQRTIREASPSDSVVQEDSLSG